jgi:hypothetical protein
MVAFYGVDGTGISKKRLSCFILTLSKIIHDYD